MLLLEVSLYISSLYKSLYTISMFLIYFLYNKLSQGLPIPSPKLLCSLLDCSQAEEPGKVSLNVVVFNWLSIDITVVDKNRHHSLEYTPFHLTHL